MRENIDRRDIITYLSAKLAEAPTLARKKTQEDGKPLGYRRVYFRIKKYIGAYLSILNKVHCIIFTAGIGENSPEMRERILSDMDELGVILDKEKNNKIKDGGEGEINANNSKIKVFVIKTDEERAIALDTYKIVNEENRKYKGG